jgi:hypothetical protein
MLMHRCPEQGRVKENLRDAISITRYGGWPGLRFVFPHPSLDIRRRNGGALYDVVE